MAIAKVKHMKLSAPGSFFFCVYMRDLLNPPVSQSVNQSESLLASQPRLITL